MSNITYLGKTAGGIMKTANVAKVQAGLIEVFVRLPDGHEAIATLTDDGAMICHRYDGVVCDLEMSAAAQDKLAALTRKADSMMLEAA